MAFTFNANAAPFTPQASKSNSTGSDLAFATQTLLRAAPTPQRSHARQQLQQLTQSVEQAQQHQQEQQQQHVDSLVVEQAPTAAVVSVRKMSAKGCAVVILRDREVLERSVAQRVAVVDGVCVEVRRHSRRSVVAEEGGLVAPGDPVGGVFCAWGHRVERRVPVSEEGLEAYFNGLVGVPTPEGLRVTPPFEEQLQRFPLTSGGRLALNMKPKADAAVPARLADSAHCSKELVHGLWDAKKELDDVWARPPPPMGRGILQRIARDQLFPHSGGKEGNEHENRAGDKLAELAGAVGLLKDVPVGASFLDLCGGPGAWSQFLLGKTELALRGFGFTLRSGTGGFDDWQAEEKDDWYGELLGRKDWKALWGKDGSGDLLKPGNLEHCTTQINKAGGAFLCVADGGFSDKDIPANLLELYFYRLLLAELLTAASCLSVGGRFVCKLYSSYSAATSSLLYLTTRLFESVSVVKPMTSRVSGPERYLVAFGFRADAELAEVKAALKCSHEVGGASSLMQTPLLTPIVSAADLAKDSGFMSQISTMVTTLCERQTVSLRATLDRADFLEQVALEAAIDPFSAAPLAKLSHAEDQCEADAPRRRRRHDRSHRE